VKKLFFISFAFCLLLLGCSQVEPGKNNINSSKINEAGNIPDSGKSKDNAVLGANDNPSGELEDIYKNYVKSYTQPYHLDSVFIIGNDKYAISLTHICTMDNGIVVPGKYVKMYGMDSFVTHNFETHLVLIKNNKTLLSRSIRKFDFETMLKESGLELNSFGVLLYPDFSITDHGIKIHYSISIPLTDVGIGTTVDISPNGELQILPVSY